MLLQCILVHFRRQICRASLQWLPWKLRKPHTTSDQEPGWYGEWRLYSLLQEWRCRRNVRRGVLRHSKEPIFIVAPRMVGYWWIPLHLVVYEQHLRRRQHDCEFDDCAHHLRRHQWQRQQHIVQQLWDALQRRAHPRHQDQSVRSANQMSSLSDVSCILNASVRNYLDWMT